MIPAAWLRLTGHTFRTDDDRIFCGAAQLNEGLGREQRTQAKSEAETSRLIMELAGLNLADEVAKGNQEDKPQRMMDMNDASQTRTSGICGLSLCCLPLFRKLRA